MSIVFLKKRLDFDSEEAIIVIFPKKGCIQSLPQPSFGLWVKRYGISSARHVPTCFPMSGNIDF